MPSHKVDLEFLKEKSHISYEQYWKKGSYHHLLNKKDEFKKKKKKNIYYSKEK